MITYQVEDFMDCYEEAIPLLVAHYDEIANFKEVKVFDPDIEKYHQLNNMGMLRILTARDDGILVGYFVSMVMPSLHYKNLTTALNDILYVDPKYRGTTVAYRLFKTAIQDLKENTQTQMVQIHMKIEYPFRELLSKIGFEKTEENWEYKI